MFLIAGLVYFIMLRWQRNKYPIETWATISSCKEYTLRKGSDTYIYHALILDFVANDNKTYQVRQDRGRINMPYLKNSKPPYSVGEQLKIYYNPNNIDLEINNSYKMTGILSHVFIWASLVLLISRNLSDFLLQIRITL